MTEAPAFAAPTAAAPVPDPAFAPVADGSAPAFPAVAPGSAAPSTGTATVKSSRTPHSAIRDSIQLTAEQQAEYDALDPKDQQKWLIDHGAEINATIWDHTKPTHLFDGYDTSVHYALTRTCFETEALYYEFKALMSDRQAEEHRAKAQECRVAGDSAVKAKMQSFNTTTNFLSTMTPAALGMDQASYDALMLGLKAQADATIANALAAQSA